MRRAFCIPLTLVLAVAVTGCGGASKRTIPTRTAESFLSQLDKIGSQFDTHSCSGAHAKVVSLVDQARALPSSVDPEVKSNLVAGLKRLDSLVQQDCQKPPPQTNTNTTPTNTAPTNTTPTNTVPSNTTPSTTPTSPGGGVTVPGTTGAGGAQLGGDQGGG